MTADQTTPEAPGPVVIEAESIVKRFGGATAVDDVSIAVRSGEIHGLVGENGAGKSTLMRILAGILTPDQGEVRVDGRPLTGGTRAALDAGIALVHQELSLVPELTTAENIMLGAFPTRLGFTNARQLRGVAATALREIGVSVDLDERVGRLSVALRQFVEIARAVARKPRVLILDEPTATLTPAETDYLLTMLQRLAEGGLAIIYISHRIPEIFRICDRVTVLRDGQLIGTTPIRATTPAALVDQMVGREYKLDLQIRRESTPGEVVLAARGVRAHRVHGVDLDVRAGEIVGLGGLVGAGRTELVRAMIGADIRTAGRVTVTAHGRTRSISSYQSAVRNGVAYVPEERRTDGLALTMSVAENIALPNRRRLATGGVLRRSRVSAFAQRLADSVGLRPPDIRKDAGDYSGGNQQKIVIAKWLGRNPKVIVLDEPTRGVDVGAKAEIHRLIRELADQGTAVLVVSSDLPELLELSDVIHVIRDGRIAGTLSGPEADERSVMSLAAGGGMVGKA
ncbi:sugar ABC transporter ATP-binding protein [Micromonospora zingiberis]|uniref:Sugar ABC transporter ATP-binding protein n=1 Tax=Micromonospora zingiberis TaxID=2053011 RepID=A0A4R0GLH3_9ACTN|nr:sugar ABC transporter ATP-binding protein [Micromonospora zingiberis]TCB98330.1 sugar ABC transporter ATP-binding protein [Micromonospora zingiberis]